MIRIYSKQIFRKSNKVTISGAISKPGDYELKTNMNLKDLILESGGFTEKHEQYKIEISRKDSTKQSNIFSNNFVVDMDGTFSIISDDYQDFKLKTNDFVTVRSKSYNKINQIVSISGAVSYPGFYALSGSDETISDIIKRAGGLSPDAYPLASKFKRNGKEIMVDLNKILKKKIKTRY